MLRSRPVQTCLARLAFVAMLLMVCAPLISRGLQSSSLGTTELCTAEGLKRITLALPIAPATAGHAGHEPGVAHLAAGSDAVDAGDPGMHTAHGEAACDYCLLAVRLLPVLLCLWALGLLAAALCPHREPATRALPRAAWPAHPARGPPLYA